MKYNTRNNKGPPHSRSPKTVLKLKHHTDVHAAAVFEIQIQTLSPFQISSLKKKIPIRSVDALSPFTSIDSFFPFNSIILQPLSDFNLIETSIGF